MANIIIKKGWEMAEGSATPEHVYRDRRRFIRELGIGGLGGLALLSGVSGALSPREALASTGPSGDLYPAPRNNEYKLDRPITRERVATRHNNYYEFTTDKGRVWRVAKDFVTRPWKIEITGLVKSPKEVDFDDLVRKFPLEERLYRFRCVEAWAMAVPWTGFPLKALIDWAEPLSAAKYVRFVSFLDPERAPEQKNSPWYPWPYFEGLRMDEARNELAMVVTGVYGKPLPAQNGSPLRVIVPWKYGYKSPKAIRKIEFVAEEPETFWHSIASNEYGFYSNVNPNKPHPRWSQRREKMIGTKKNYDTIIYNGYGEFVAHLYK